MSDNDVRWGGGLWRGCMGDNDGGEEGGGGFM